MLYGCATDDVCHDGTGYKFITTSESTDPDIEFCCNADGCNAESLLETPPPPPPPTTTTTTENPSLKLGEMLLKILDARYVKKADN